MEDEYRFFFVLHIWHLSLLYSYCISSHINGIFYWSVVIALLNKNIRHTRFRNKISYWLQFTVTYFPLYHALHNDAQYLIFEYKEDNILHLNQFRLFISSEEFHVLFQLFYTNNVIKLYSFITVNQG